MFPEEGGLRVLSGEHVPVLERALHAHAPRDGVMRALASLEPLNPEARHKLDDAALSRLLDQVLTLSAVEASRESATGRAQAAEHAALALQTILHQ